ncbi:MAG: glycosyltransferase [Actinobacteria bacterium]|nr:glycosyltransferase [Actinomycetota bacterium]
MIKIGIYDRYLSTAGGGERYSCKMAEVLANNKEYQVELLTDLHADPERVSERLNIDLSGINLKVFPFLSNDYAEKITSKYHLFINATYLSSLPAYGSKNIYLCYFPTPFDIDFGAIHRFLLLFFRAPAVWLYNYASRLSGGFEELNVEEGIYDLKRFMLGRGSWSSGRVVIKVAGRMGTPMNHIRMGLKNPEGSGLEKMKVRLWSEECCHIGERQPVPGETGTKENILFEKELQIARGTREIIDIPLGSGDGDSLIVIESTTFTALDSAAGEKKGGDSRKLGVALYDLRPVPLIKKIVLKVLGYIPLFLVTYPRDLKFLDTYQEIIAISQYTRKWIKRLWKKESRILFPPVDVENMEAKKKVKIILSVGRFFPDHHNKKQFEMARVFTEMIRENPRDLEGYTLCLAGGVGSNPAHQKYLESIKELVGGYPVNILPNISWNELKELFSRSLIFWHAAGMDEDEETHPEKSEHFGITTVEAMASGCIPVVVNKGGQKEIITEGIDGFLFESWNELKEKTLGIIRGEVDIEKIKEKAIVSCRRFSNAAFAENLQLLVGEILKDGIK